ncbi:MAG TPA: hypothetical protein VGF69_14890 [Thermoanaerobaculia bacterium]
MRLTITTDGGFTGRGIGSVTIDDPESREELREALANARPETWQPEYAAGGADLVRYTLTLDGVSVTWVETAVIPDDLRRLFTAAWRR